MSVLADSDPANTERVWILSFKSNSNTSWRGTEWEDSEVGTKEVKSKAELEISSLQHSPGRQQEK